MVGDDMKHFCNIIQVQIFVQAYNNTENAIEATFLRLVESFFYYSVFSFC